MIVHIRFIQFICPVFYPEGSIHYQRMHYLFVHAITLFGYAKQRLCTYLRSAGRIPCILSLSSVTYRLCVYMNAIGQTQVEHNRSKPNDK